MRKTALALLATTALLTPLALSSVAEAALCVAAPATTFNTVNLGSCEVGPVTFSDVVVNTLVSGTGSLTLGNLTPTTFVGPTGETEYGLALNYIGSTGLFGEVDIAWTYNVAAQFLTDAYASLATTLTGIGAISSVSEVLSNGVVLSINGAGIDFETFPPVGSLGVIKDQINISGPDGSGTANPSILVNAFSVPGPIVGAGLPGLIAACGGLLALARRRRQRVAA
jgi:hypothetical protein